MQKKDILELKRRFKKDACTFTKLRGCYVDNQKKYSLTYRRNLSQSGGG